MTQVKPPELYQLVPSPFGEVGVVWCLGERKPFIRSVFLPQAGVPTIRLIGDVFPGAGKAPKTHGTDVTRKIEGLIKGAAVDVSLDDLDMSVCSNFQKKVLFETFRIRRGFVRTYGQLADQLGIPGGARAVGTVQARNPFPLFIPCHRVIRTGGHLGGFGGGLEMKRRLLEMEGVTFDQRGWVMPACITRNLR